MMEWRKVAKAFALADGHVSQKEVSILREYILEDEYVSKSELAFLHEIKDEATSSVQLLDELIVECEAAIKKSAACVAMQK
jgi:hypothetical protein